VSVDTCGRLVLAFWLLVSSIADLLIASTLAVGGIAMTSLPVWIVVAKLAAAAVFAVVLDFVKVPVFRHLGIRVSTAWRSVYPRKRTLVG
jgi:hypothetical protein